MTNRTFPTALLLEDDPPLRDLEEQLLIEVGFRVEVLPNGADPVAYAAQTRPTVIVVHLGHYEPYQLSLLDELHANPATRTIPVVVIAMAEMTAALAQAGPNVYRAVVAPYDITALEDAVTRAVGLPPPAATLPQRSSPLPESVRFALDTVNAHARVIVVEAVEQLRQIEPFRSRFDELTVGLVDDLGVMLSAIVTGIERGLRPDEVFGTPEIAERIEQHLQLRRQQGLGMDAIVEENRQLQHRVDVFLLRLVGQDHVTAADALRLMRQIDTYVRALTQATRTKAQHAGSSSSA